MPLQRVFKHNDPAHLESLLKADQHLPGGRLIVFESVYSMDGTIAPIPAIVQVAKKYKVVGHLWQLAKS